MWNLETGRISSIRDWEEYNYDASLECDVEGDSWSLCLVFNMRGSRTMWINGNIVANFQFVNKVCSFTDERNLDIAILHADSGIGVSETDCDYMRNGRKRVFYGDRSTYGQWWRES